MKYFGLALAAAGLLIQTSGAYAISFAPPRSMAAPAGETALSKLTVGLSASSWGLPDISNVSLVGDKIEFESQVRPLLTAEYQVDDKLSVGGWYNAVSWDANYLSPSSSKTPIANVVGSLFEIHGTYALREGYAAQLGFQRSSLDVDMSQIGGGSDTVETNLATLWGLKTVSFNGEQAKNFNMLLGLGLAQGLDKDSGSTQANALVGGSYAISPRLSADASVWFSDFTRKVDSVTRFTAGVTGRF